MTNRFVFAVLAVGLFSSTGLRPSRIADSPQASAGVRELPRIAWNDNTEPAGTLRGGVLELNLAIVEGVWHVLGDDEPGGQVLGFAEVGKEPSNPGPLIQEDHPCPHS